MEKNRRKWIISVATIAIIVPVSLVMLSLNGFFSQSPTPEGITAETVTWEIERPYHTVDILDLVENINTNNEASVGLGVSINKYIENFQDYGGTDFINMNVSMTANSRMGVTYQAL